MNDPGYYLLGLAASAMSGFVVGFIVGVLV
jgi:basic membrane lipoprotein Med (substrate-binding protein (PBP1-ABC) superfamily)